MAPPRAARGGSAPSWSPVPQLHCPGQVPSCQLRLHLLHHAHVRLVAGTAPYSNCPPRITATPITTWERIGRWSWSAHGDNTSALLTVRFGTTDVEVSRRGVKANLVRPCPVHHLCHLGFHHQQRAHGTGALVLTNLLQPEDHLVLPDSRDPGQLGGGGQGAKGDIAEAPGSKLPAPHPSRTSRVRSSTSRRSRQRPPTKYAPPLGRSPRAGGCRHSLSSGAMAHCK
jgi:hypothetical protein